MNETMQPETKQIEIETLLPWGQPKEVQTKAGRRILRKSVPTETFWSLWKTNQSDLRAAGISVGRDYKDATKWEACWWAPISKEQAAKENAAIEASRASDANITVPVPDGLSYMPFQKAGIAWMQNHPATLLGDDMGVGKTIQMIGLINSDAAIKRVLIICPASVRINWKREMDKWLVSPRNVVIQYSNQPWVGGAADVVIINYDIVKKFEAQLTAIEWDLFCSDEAHYLKSPSANRTQIILGCKAWKDRPEHKGIQAKRRVFASGTLVVNRPIELFPMLHAVDPKAWPSKMKYGVRYCAAHETRFGWDFSGASNLDELHRILRSRWMIRRMKSEVLTELPPKTRQIIELPANGAMAAIEAENDAFEEYESMLAEIRARIEVAALANDQATYESESGKLKKAQAVAFAEMSKVRHQTAMAKLQMCIEHIRDVLEEVPKLVVMAHHRDLVEAIAAEFKDCGAVMLYGGMDDKDKDASVQAFQKDPNCRLFVGSITAAGVGLTLTAASMMIFCELDWRPGIVTQAEDREHRIGAVNPVLIQHLVLEGSLDARMVRVTIQKQNVIDRMFDKGAKQEVGEDVATMIDLIGAPESPVPVCAPKIDKHQTMTQPDLPVTDALRAHVHAGLQRLAGVCNYANSWDGAGFSKFDAAFGHALAEHTFLTDKMVVAGAKLCNKYRKQLGDPFAQELETLKQALMATSMSRR
jgi:SWI/SNF-related matrix-associated actin-dependent regulator 1 of chromatin subfamily A